MCNVLKRQEDDCLILDFLSEAKKKLSIRTFTRFVIIYGSSLVFRIRHFFLDEKVSKKSRPVKHPVQWSGPGLSNWAIFVFDYRFVCPI